MNLLSKIEKKKQVGASAAVTSQAENAMATDHNDMVQENTCYAVVGIQLETQTLSMGMLVQLYLT